MKSSRLSISRGSCLLASLLALPALSTEPTPSGPVQTGRPGARRAAPHHIIDLLMPPFRDLMKQFTGLDARSRVGGDSFDVARKLDENKLQIAVFHGVEFGWASAEVSPISGRSWSSSTRRRRSGPTWSSRTKAAQTDLAGLPGKISCGAVPAVGSIARMFLDKRMRIRLQGNTATSFFEEKVTKPHVGGDGGSTRCCWARSRPP